MTGPLKMFLAFTLLKVPPSAPLDVYVSFAFAIGGSPSEHSTVSSRVAGLSTIAPDAAPRAAQTGQTVWHTQLKSDVKGGTTMSVPTPTAAYIPDEDVAGSSTDLPDPTDVERLFGAHEANVQRLRDRYGAELAAMNVGEQLAMQALLTEQLAAVSDETLSETVVCDDAELSPGDISRIAEENHRRFYHFQCRLAFLLEGWFETVEARGATLAHQGKQPFKNAKDFIARLNGIDIKEVERRLRIATANPTKPGASKMRAPKIQRAMAAGRIDPSSANFIIDRLRSIRAASKRAGATDAQADRLVATKEGEFLAKALRAGPEEVRKFTDRVKRSTNRKFTKPGTRLTSKQRQYEEGLRFVSPLGDTHVRLDWVLTKWEYRHVLERLRQHVNNLRTQISRLKEDAQQHRKGTRKSGADRITPPDEEFQMPLLYDNRTPAQRWSRFLLDILETGIVLTNFTAGKVQDHLNRHTVDDTTATQDTQQVAKTPHDDVHPEDIAPSGALIPGLGRLVNVAPSVTVGMQYADLTGQYLDFGADDPNVQAEITALLDGSKPFPELYDYDTMDLDWARLRLMACNASIIPMVLNSKGEPLDVGRSQRAFPAGIRRAVIMRDGGCAYPGCNMPHIYSEVHHIRAWQDGGTTSLENAVMLCRFHHLIIHQTEVVVRLNADRFPEFLLEPNTPEAHWVRNHMHRG